MSMRSARPRSEATGKAVAGCAPARWENKATATAFHPQAPSVPHSRKARPGSAGRCAEGNCASRVRQRVANCLRAALCARDRRPGRAPSPCAASG
eukprot:6681417-Alexandrium_andersonii.AAC.1